jgi:hypothetical protein
MSEMVYRVTRENDVSAPPPGVAVPVAGEPNEKSIIFGIVFKLRDQEIRVMTTDIAEPLAKGVDLRLPEPARLGTIDDIFKWFEEQFDVKLPKGDTFPYPLDEVFIKIVSLVWTVEEAHIYVPPGDKSNKEDPTTYTLTVSAEWPDKGITLVPGVLEIKGAVFGLTNETPQPLTNQTQPLAP